MREISAMKEEKGK